MAMDEDENLSNARRVGLALVIVFQLDSLSLDQPPPSKQPLPAPSIFQLGSLTLSQVGAPPLPALLTSPAPPHHLHLEEGREVRSTSLGSCDYDKV